MVDLHCPICNRWRTVPSLDILIEKSKKGWEKFKPTKELMEQIDRINDKERMQKVLDEKGYLTAFCTGCVTGLFIKLAHDKFKSVKTA